jgi:hypothetical protein
MTRMQVFAPTLDRPARLALFSMRRHTPLRSARRALALEVRATVTRASGLEWRGLEPEARRSSRTVASARAHARVSEAYPSRTVKGTVGVFRGRRRRKSLRVASGREE